MCLCRAEVRLNLIDALLQHEDRFLVLQRQQQPRFFSDQSVIITD